MLYGDIVDQAALHRMLNEVHDLGLPLLALRSGDLYLQEPAIQPAPYWLD